MEDLIRALQIFLEYSNLENPINCEHDSLYIVGISPDEVSYAHILELDTLGFTINDDLECFESKRFGSA